jgi:DNA-directed RNA polymerase subunit alpha
VAGLALPKVECVESTETYGRFVAEPLERGFGTTLGNSLRRVLLSSLPGAAVTWVWIEGIQHEFSTIPHMKEDVIEFLLNVKAIRFRHAGQSAGRARLEVQGEGEVCAGDIQTPADFEIVNPELHLATLDSAEAKLMIEFNIEVGRGYVPAKSTDNLPAGAIPVDAIFSPVRRANFSVEPSSAREGSTLEKLILEIWTDGTLSPLEALSQSATILVEQFNCFRELVKAVVQEGAEVVWQRIIPPEQYLMPLDQLPLSTHTYNSLRRGGITTVGQVLEKGLDKLTSLPGFGVKSREEVQVALEQLGIPLVMEGKGKRRGRQKASSVSQEEAAVETDEG